MAPLNKSTHTQPHHGHHCHPELQDELSLGGFRPADGGLSRRRGRASQLCPSGFPSNRKKSPTQRIKLVKGNRWITLALILLSTATISKAHDIKQSNAHPIQRHLRHRKGDPPDTPTYQQDNDYTGGYSDDTTSTSESSYGGYSSNSAYGDYGAYTPGGSSSLGESESSSSGYDPYDSYGSSSYGSSATSYGSESSYGSSSSTSYGESYEWEGSSSKSSPFAAPTFKMPELQLSIIPAIFLLLLTSLIGMLLTAYQMEHHPEGTYANCCRVSLTTVSCIYKVIYNLYHCRLGDIPEVVFASEFEEDGELTEEELERMKLRPGIERALDVEHRKALRRVGIEMERIKVKNGRPSDGGNGLNG